LTAPGVNYCAHCGSPVRGGTSFCEKCGATLSAGAPPDPAGLTVTGQAPPVSDAPPPPPPGTYPPPPYRSAYAPPAYGPPPAGPTTNGFSIASLVLGIVWVFGVGAILAVIFGFIARRQIRESGGRQGGDGMALAGIILGFVGIAGLILWIVFVLVAVHSLDTCLNQISDNPNSVCGSTGTGSNTGTSGNSLNSGSFGTSGTSANTGATGSTFNSGSGTGPVSGPLFAFL
jgi:hypothetical protein